MRVLVVDDDPALRAAIRRMLTAVAVEVVEAGDGDEALRLLSREPADVVLCDMFMPNRDGIEVLRAMRERFPGVRAVAMSGGGFGGTVDMLPVARALGAAAVLPKPFTQAAALEAICRAMAEA